jgi:hypothetical protein
MTMKTKITHEQVVALVRETGIADPGGNIYTTCACMLEVDPSTTPQQVRDAWAEAEEVWSAERDAD